MKRERAYWQQTPNREIIRCSHCKMYYAVRELFPRKFCPSCGYEMSEDEEKRNET